MQVGSWKAPKPRLTSSVDNCSSNKQHTNMHSNWSVGGCLKCHLAHLQKPCWAKGTFVKSHIQVVLCSRPTTTHHSRARQLLRGLSSSAGSICWVGVRPLCRRWCRCARLRCVARKAVVLVFVELVTLEREEGTSADTGLVVGVGAKKFVQQHDLDIKHLHTKHNTQPHWSQGHTLCTRAM